MSVAGSSPAGAQVRTRTRGSQSMSFSHIDVSLAFPSLPLSKSMGKQPWVRIFKKHSNVLVVGNVRNMKRKRKSCPFPREGCCPHHAGFPFSDAASADLQLAHGASDAQVPAGTTPSLGLSSHPLQAETSEYRSVCLLFPFSTLCGGIPGHNPRSGHGLSRP